MKPAIKLFFIPALVITVVYSSFTMSCRNTSYYTKQSIGQDTVTVSTTDKNVVVNGTFSTKSPDTRFEVYSVDSHFHATVVVSGGRASVMLVGSALK